MQTLLDLFCGLGGWSAPAVAAHHHCIGIDAAPFNYPGNFRQQRLPMPLAQIAAIHPRLIVASPPCEEYARHHLPWLHGPPPDTALLRWALTLIDVCPFPVIVECSRFAALYFPGSRSAGSYHLWGALPPSLPVLKGTKQKTSGRFPARRAYIPPALAIPLLTYHGFSNLT